MAIWRSAEATGGRGLGAFLALLWQVHKGFASAILLLRAGRALVPIGQLWIAKLILDTIVSAPQHAHASGRLWMLVGFEMALTVASDVLNRASILVESLLADLFSTHASARLMTTVATFSLEQIEHPDYNDRLQRALEQTGGTRLELVSHLLNAAQNVFALCVFAVAVMSYRADLGLLLLVSVLPSFLTESHFGILHYSMLFRLTPERRELEYLRSLATRPRYANEVRAFRIAPWLISRYRRLSEKFYAENSRLAWRRTAVTVVVALVGTAGYYAAYVIIITAALGGKITLGQLTFLAGSFLRSRDLVQTLVVIASGIHQHLLHLRDLFALLDGDKRSPDEPARALRHVPARIQRGFEFQQVGFRYPGATTWALRGLDFRLRPGECVALVGENGAGKTSFTRLLSGLYEPTEGRILLDGVDLREYDSHSLRDAVSIVFQDFVKYAMRFDENIGVGRVDAVRDFLDQHREWSRRLDGTAVRDVPGCIRAAAEQSLASDVLRRLPDGYTQMLGTMFQHGVNLSGGEWQKVALGRAHLRAQGAQLLILDEPSAALDARAECEVFRQFARLAERRMTVLVSHRFSTTRMADRVLMLHNGSIAESGTHDELLSYRGRYAELFFLQAAGYRDDMPAVPVAAPAVAAGVTR